MDRTRHDMHGTEDKTEDRTAQDKRKDRTVKHRTGQDKTRHKIAPGIRQNKG